METSIVIAGFGGQGVLFAGQVLAYAALDQDLHVTWFPSYGPEMRGGTANCTVVVGDEPIGSPLVRNPHVVIAMNRPSMDKYEPLVKPNGLLLINSSLVNRPLERDDIQAVGIPANHMAENLFGNTRLANMIMLGALIALRPIMPLEAVKDALANHLPERHRHLLDANFRALETGAEYVQENILV